MPDRIEIRATPWTTILLVCSKCTRKMDGGYGPKGKDTLKDALRSAPKAPGQRRQLRIIETRRMGPKKAVTIRNTSLPGTIMTIGKRTGTEEVLATLLDS